jgi:phosphoserine phosphatase
MNVYDFDNTIYDGESGLDIFLFFFKLDPLGVFKYAGKFGEGFIRYKRNKIQIDDVKNEYGYMLKEYLAKVENLDEKLECFWDKKQKKIKPFYESVRKNDDIIISACPEPMLKIMLNRMGIDDSRIIGTEVDLSTGEIGRVNYRENKAKAFVQLFPDAEIDDFYTDSMSDAPLMELAKRVFMVDGSKITEFDYKAYKEKQA